MSQGDFPSTGHALLHCLSVSSQAFMHFIIPSALPGFEASFGSPVHAFMHSEAVVLHRVAHCESGA